MILLYFYPNTFTFVNDTNIISFSEAEFIEFEPSTQKVWPLGPSLMKKDVFKLHY